MFYILAREKGGVWATLEIDFNSLEDAKYEVACLKDVDKANGEEWEYRIVEVEKIERR